MKVLLVTLNAKYLHTNRAIRLLTRLAEPYFDTQFREYTIKDSFADLIHKIQSESADVIGFSIYIWNVEKTLELIRQLKPLMPATIFIAGGPEVSYDTAYFFTQAPLDYIVAGEAEDVWVPLLQTLDKKEIPHLNGVATRVHPEMEALEVQHLTTVPDILDLYSEDDLAHRIIYLESSRGCPFHCSFCLSSLNHGVRYFPLTSIYHQLNVLTSKGATTIKFLDRTMNAHPQRMKALCDYIAQLNQPLVLQFEVAGDSLTPLLMDYFLHHVKPGMLRLEIGVQSTHEEAIKAVDRFQRIDHLLDVIRQLVQSQRVVVHADLIAGLPFDTLATIRKSINEVFLTFPHELQLGFLKMLRGSKIRKESDLYHYQFHEKAPYEIIANDFINETELNEVRKVEQVIELVWNHRRADALIRQLYEDHQLADPYAFFALIAHHPQFNERMELTAFYRLMMEIVQHQFPNTSYSDDLKLSYLAIHPIKPVAWWPFANLNRDQVAEQINQWTNGKITFNEIKQSFITTYKNGYILLRYSPLIEGFRITPERFDRFLVKQV